MDRVLMGMPITIELVDPQATQRHLGAKTRRDLFQFLLGHAGLAEDRRGNRTGADDIDPDLLCCKFNGQSLGETVQGRFAGGVNGLPGGAHVADHRRNVDNPPRALFEKSAAQGAREKEGAFEVRIQDGVPIHVAHTHQQAVARHAISQCPPKDLEQRICGTRDFANFHGVTEVPASFCET